MLLGTSIVQGRSGYPHFTPSIFSYISACMVSLYLLHLHLLHCTCCTVLAALVPLLAALAAYISGVPLLAVRYGTAHSGSSCAAAEVLLDHYLQWTSLWFLVWVIRVGGRGLSPFLPSLCGRHRTQSCTYRVIGYPVNSQC